jgi:hypothetical protein
MVIVIWVLDHLHHFIVWQMAPTRHGDYAAIVWLLIAQMQHRYHCSKMSILRRSSDGRLPPPQFPFGNNIRAWQEAVLDRHDLEICAAAEADQEAAKARSEAGKRLQKGREAKKLKNRRHRATRTRKRKAASSAINEAELVPAE